MSLKTTAIIGAVLLAALVAMGYLLKGAYEENGMLATAVEVEKATVKAITDDRDKWHRQAANTATLHEAINAIDERIATRTAEQGRNLARVERLIGNARENDKETAEWHGTRYPDAVARVLCGHGYFGDPGTEHYASVCETGSPEPVAGGLRPAGARGDDQWRPPELGHATAQRDEPVQYALE